MATWLCQGPVCLTVHSRAFSIQQSAASEAAKFGGGGVEFLGVVGAARHECGEPAAEAGELIRRQLDDCLGDLFDFHAAQYNTIEAQANRFGRPSRPSPHGLSLGMCSRMTWMPLRSVNLSPG